MASKELIYLADARRAILKHTPEMAFCLEGLKKVDAVEVVRCNDCVLWQRYQGKCNSGFGLCQAMCERTEENDFCSWGERKK